MRRVLALALLVLASIGSVSDRLIACGDKFVIVGWGPQQRKPYAARVPSSILIFARPGGSAALADPKFVSKLTLAGHTVSVVKDERQLDQALAAGNFALALTTLKDAEQLAHHVPATVSGPIAQPVLAKSSKTEATLCKQQQHFKCDLELTDKPDDFLKTIDKVLQEREKQKQKK